MKEDAPLPVSSALAVKRMRIPAKKKISARSHKQRVHDIVAREKAVREDYDNIRLGHTAMRVEFDQQRRAKAKAKVKGKEMQAKIENLEMIIKEYYVEGDRVDLMEERFPVLMASRVERLKRQILEEERDQQLAEGACVVAAASVLFFLSSFPSFFSCLCRNVQTAFLSCLTWISMVTRTDSKVKQSGSYNVRGGGI